MPLTDAAIRNAKPSGKQFKITDGHGMYVLVNKAGKYLPSTHTRIWIDLDRRLYTS